MTVVRLLSECCLQQFLMAGSIVSNWEVLSCLVLSFFFFFKGSEVQYEKDLNIIRDGERSREWRRILLRSHRIVHHKHTAEPFFGLSNCLHFFFRKHLWLQETKLHEPALATIKSDEKRREKKNRKKEGVKHERKRKQGAKDDYWRTMDQSGDLAKKKRNYRTTYYKNTQRGICYPAGSPP